MTAKELIKELEDILSQREGKDVEFVVVDIGFRKTHQVVGTVLMEEMKEYEYKDAIILVTPETQNNTKKILDDVMKGLDPFPGDVSSN